MKKFKLSLPGVSLACTLGIAAALTGLPQIGFSAGGGAELEHFSPVRTDKSLQRGAKIFVNYCQVVIPPIINATLDWRKI